MTTLMEPPREQRFRFNCIDWDRYLAMIDLLEESHVRVTYSEGTLEVMTLSIEHEGAGRLLGRFVETLTEEQNIPMKSGGSTTFNRKAVARGLEPDECYYLENAVKIQGKKRLDLTIDPPPDLALEIDITRSSLDRMAIYAGLGVPEVWRFDGTTLSVWNLVGKEYRLVERSRHFPYLPMAEVQRFLLRADEMDETKLVREFRQWVREQMKQGWKKG